MISIITATYNSAERIKNVCESLNSQVSKNFEWIVVDSSDDNTTQIIEDIFMYRKKIIESYPPQGVYDALNTGIKNISTNSKYYMVLGDDDTIYPDTIAKVLENLSTNSENIITGDIISNGKRYTLSRLPFLLSGMQSMITGHSVGAVFNKHLHEVFGYYSIEYRIASDFEFMSKCYLANISAKHLPVVFGEFGRNGLSSNEYNKAHKEVDEIKYKMGYSKLVIKAVRYLKTFNQLF
jgi:glycosyltransferase involved in cell wall biosynthesis